MIQEILYNIHSGINCKMIISLGGFGMLIVPPQEKEGVTDVKKT